MKILQLARANGCRWDAGAYAHAVKEGGNEFAKWARANGCDNIKPRMGRDIELDRFYL